MTHRDHRRKAEHDRASQLTVFPEAPGRRVWRKEVHLPLERELTADDRERGPKVDLPDGIHIVTVSENTPARLFEAAHLLTAVSEAWINHADGFVPSDRYDSAIAVVRGRVVGGLIAGRNLPTHLRRVLGDPSGQTAAESQNRPVIWYVWVHPAHRRKRLARQLLEATASHFRRRVAEMGFRLPIFEGAEAVLLSMGIKEVAGCQ
jgi:GNAT superfamily N-acetyltransferase